MAKKRGMPEAPSATTKESKRPRATLERLLDVGPGFPAEARRRVAELTKLLEPYEEFAETFGTGEIDDKLALIEILEQSGVISPQFIAECEAIGRTVNAARVKIEEKMIGVTVQNAARIQNQVQKETRDLHRASASVASRLANDNRILARSAVAAALHVSFLLSLEQYISRDGLTAVRDYYKDPSTPVDRDTRLHAQRYLDYIRYASAMSKLPEREYRTKEGEFTVQEKWRFIRDSEFVKSEPLIYLLPYADGNNNRATLSILISENSNAFSLAGFSVRMGDFRIGGTLSRITGELHPVGALFATMEEAFRFGKGLHNYRYLRAAIVSAIYDAWEKGKITERVYVSVPPSTNASSNEGNDDAMGDQTVVHNVVLAPPVETSVTHETKRENRQEDKGSYSWRRVMAALKRCGVEVRMGGSHPKLIYGSKTTGYLNSHESDPVRNWKVVQETLDDLGIPFATFKSKLY